ncbi:hypothetical protein [Oceanivirga salmonicida]|uniref:hypothetical protein n=1 Tax=Oceanivirga salmonicida TaxID=1769291 RepID=UPI00083527D1|nr:hypothetical protein [Oceanivirga salmonicida]
MKRKIMFICILIMLQSCTAFRNIFSSNDDPYGRVIETIENKQTKRKLTTTEKNLYKEVSKAKKEKRELVLTKEEQKLYDEIYNSNREETKHKKHTSSKVTLSEDGKEVLRLMKKVYNLIEPYDVMQKKTIEAVEKIREQKNPDEDPLIVIKEIHKILKETRTRSFTLAVARVMRNRGIK